MEWQDKYKTRDIHIPFWLYLRFLNWLTFFFLYHIWYLLFCITFYWWTNVEWTSLMTINYLILNYAGCCLVCRYCWLRNLCCLDFTWENDVFNNRERTFSCSKLKMKLIKWKHMLKYKCMILFKYMEMFMYSRILLLDWALSQQ